MFERIVVDTSNQWIQTTLGTLVEASLFYEKVHLITPVRKLGELLNAPDALRVLEYLTRNGHLTIEAEQFPAGEVAISLNLIDAGLSAVINHGELSDPGYRPEVSFAAALYEEYERFGERVAARLFDESAAIASPDKLEKIDHLASGIVVPSISVDYVNAKIEGLREVLNYCSQSDLLQRALEYDNRLDGQRRDVRLEFSEKSRNGALIKSVASNSLGPGSLLAAVSFASFLIDNGKREGFQDIYTANKFNQLMGEIYSRNIELISGQRDIDAFQFSVLRTVPIRESFDSGRLEFAAIQSAIEAKQHLLREVRGKSSDKGLVEWYYSEASAGVLCDTTAKKSVRFGLASAPGILLDVFGAGGIGTAIGLGIGAVDALLLDRLLKKRGPRTYVEEHLRPLARKD